MTLTQFRLKGPSIGENQATVSATVGGNTAGAPVTSFQLPAPVSVLPRISDGFSGDTLTVDTTGLSSVTAYDWRIVGGVTQGTAATLDTTGLGLAGAWIECAVTHAGGTAVSPAVMVYMSHAMAGDHDATDAAIVKLVPHNQVTHVAIADGNWTDPATWLNGRVPRNGAFVLIPNGRTVTYDETGVYRLDRVRIDGTLQVTTAASIATRMLVETMVVTRDGGFICGTAANRIPTTSSFTLTISGKDYSSTSHIPTDLKSANFLNTLGWGRGFICQGLCRIWGMQKTTWLRAAVGVPQGATEITLSKVPVGWNVNDEVIVGATAINYSPNTLIQTEDEVRTITAINGATITLNSPLTNPHENQLPGYEQDDLTPIIAVRGGGNVVFRSEVTTPAYRRGHFAMVHSHSTTDLWGLNVISFGRTDKRRFPDGTFGGTIDASKPVGEQFKVVAEGAANGNTKFLPLSPQSNLISRYSIHLHHVGFRHDLAGRPRPIVRDCYVEDVPGWGYVHHASDADFFNCVGYRIAGAGMVGESGNELGAWKDCVMIKSVSPIVTNLNLSPKTYEPDRRYNSGDMGGYGTGYVMRGRAMRVVGCVAVSMGLGYQFLHRATKPVDANKELIISPRINPSRDGIDLRHAQVFGRGAAAPSEWSHVDYPITHFADNEIIACVQGIFVTKSNSDQFHDVNVRFKRIRTWGWSHSGLGPEYVQNYLFEDCQSIAGPYSVLNSRCFVAGGSTYQIGFARCRAVGGANALYFSVLDNEDPQGGYEKHDNTVSPQYYIVGLDAVLQTGTRIAGGSEMRPVSAVLIENPDWQNDSINQTQDPILTYPTMEMGSYDGSTLVENYTNVDGGKTDNLAANAKMLPKPTDTLFPTAGQLGQYRYWMGGYHTVSSQPVIAGPMFISDRVTGRPAKITIWYNYNVQWPVGMNFGELDLTAIPVELNDKYIPVATNGSVVIDVLNPMPTGGNGVTYELDYNHPQSDHLKPDHGVAVLDETAGTITFTPDPDYVGTDEMTVFVRSGPRYGTMRINFLIGPGGPVTAPAVTTNFTVADGGDSASINVRLHAFPACGNRYIRTTEYSTDGGTTWRRLCQTWAPAMHKITVKSDGTAITPGSYNVSIRYLTNYDFSTSGSSATAAVTVS